MLFHIFSVAYSLSWTVFLCYFANFATDQVTAIGNTLYNSNWFEYTIDVQKYVILMIARSQEAIHFTGFNLFPCTLEMLGKVKTF